MGEKNNKTILGQLTDFVKAILEADTYYKLIALALGAIIIIVSWLILKSVEFSITGWQATLILVMLIFAITFLLYLASKSSETDQQDLPEIPYLKPPDRSKLGILIDKSHGQGDWDSSNDTIFNSDLINRLLSAELQGQKDPWWEIETISERESFMHENFSRWDALIIGLPRKHKIERDHIEIIVNWVKEGGNLLLLSYELGDRHHDGNLNELAKHFGIRFNSDILVDEDFNGTNPYGTIVTFESNEYDFGHPIFNDLQSISMSNVSTIIIEPGSDNILQVGNKKIGIWINPSYTNGYTSTGNTKDFEYEKCDWFSVIAGPHSDLRGKGNVMAIGTWKFYKNESNLKSDENRQFVINLIKWLADMN